MANEVIDFTEENAPSPDIDFQEEPLKETALRTAIEAPGAVNRLITRQIEGGALATPEKIVPPKPQEFMAGAGPTAGLPLAAPPAARSAIQTLTQPGRDFIQAVEDIGAEGMRNLGIDPSAQAGQPMINIPRIPTGLGMISEGLRRANVIPPNPVSNVLEGIERTAGETVTGFTSPGMAVGAPFLGEGKVAQSVFGMGARAASKAAAILFASEQFESLPDQVKESLRVLRDPNAGTADKTAALLRPGVATVIGVTMAKHGIAREPGLPPGEGYFKGEMPPLELTGAELPGRPTGVIPIRPTAGAEVLGPEAPARFRRPEVPVTAPEPMRDLSMAEEERIGRQLQIEQVQKAGARTKEAVQKLFPAMNRQQAAALRDAAWPKAPEVAPPIQRRGLSLEKATEIANKEGGTILERGRGNFEVVPPEEPPPAAPAAEPVTKPPGPAPAAPEPAAKELPGIEEARGAATESGWTLKTGQKAAGISIPDDLSGYSPEDQAKLKKLMAAQPRVYEFTDTREDSPTRAATIYVPEGTPKAEILRRINEFAEQDRAKKAATAPAAPPAAPTAPEIEWMGKPLSFWGALANDLPKGDERARLAKSLGVPNQPSKITQHIKRRIEEIRRNAAAPKPEPTVTLYSGSGGAEGAGQGGQWFTAKAEKARTFGPNVQAVEVPKSVADAAKAAAEKSGQGGDTYFLEKKWSDKAAPIEAPPEVVHEIPEEPTAPEVKPTPAVPAAPGELLSVPPSAPPVETQRANIVKLLEQLQDQDEKGRLTERELEGNTDDLWRQAANLLGKDWGEVLELDQSQLIKALRDRLGVIERGKLAGGLVNPVVPQQQAPNASLARIGFVFRKVQDGIGNNTAVDLLDLVDTEIADNPGSIPEGLKKAAVDYRKAIDESFEAGKKVEPAFMAEVRKALEAKELPAATKPAEPATKPAEPAQHPIDGLLPQVGIESGKGKVSDDGKTYRTPPISKGAYEDLWKLVEKENVGWHVVGYDKKGSKYIGEFKKDLTENEKKIAKLEQRIGMLQSAADHPEESMMQIGGEKIGPENAQRYIDEAQAEINALKSETGKSEAAAPESAYKPTYSKGAKVRFDRGQGKMETGTVIEPAKEQGGFAVVDTGKYGEVIRTHIAEGNLMAQPEVVKLIDADGTKFDFEFNPDIYGRRDDVIYEKATGRTIGRMVKPEAGEATKLTPEQQKTLDRYERLSDQASAAWMNDIHDAKKQRASENAQKRLDDYKRSLGIETVKEANERVGAELEATSQWKQKVGLEGPIRPAPSKEMHLPPPVEVQGELYEFKPEEVKKANLACRVCGAVGGGAITPKHVQKTSSRTETILDFGAGDQAPHTKTLKADGFNVTAYEFGQNVVEGIHDTKALERKYDTVFASNVLNVQSGRPMLRATLKEIFDATGGRALFNYPRKPRYSALSTTEVAKEIQDIFGVAPTRVGGTPDAPIWEVRTDGKTPTAPGGKAPAEAAAKPVTSVPRASLTLPEQRVAPEAGKPFKAELPPDLQAKADEANTGQARLDEMLPRMNSLQQKAAFGLSGPEAKEYNALVAEANEIRKRIVPLQNELFDYRWAQESARFRGQEEPPPSEPVITTKILKAQKANLLEQVDQAIQEAPEKGTGKIKISVPGDGEFTLHNNREALKKFRAVADKGAKVTNEKGAKERGPFPATVEPSEAIVGGRAGGMPASITKSGEPSAMPKVKEPTDDIRAKVAARSTSQGEKREAIETVYSDGTQMVATNGRQMIRIVTNDAPGSPSEPVRLNSEGHVDRDVTSDFPNFPQVIPPDPTLALGGTPTDALWKLVKQGQVFISSYGDEAPQHFELFINPDRSVGGKVKMPNGDMFEHNVQDGAKGIGGYNVNYLLNAADALRRLGNDSADIYLESTTGPLELVGKNSQHIMMPVRLEGGAGADVREDPRKFPASFPGKKAHTRPGPGLPPLKNAEGFRSRDVAGYQVSYEGGKFKVEVGRPGGYRGEKIMTTVAEFDRGDQNATDLAQGIVKATGKAVDPKVTKAILDSMKAIEAERGEIIKEGKARERGRPKLPPGISMGPGAASPAEFEQGMPSSQALGIDTGNPLLNRIRARVANFGRGLTQLFARTENKKDIASLVNAARNLPRFIGQTAGTTLRLRADKPERHAVTFIMQALKMSGDGLTPEAMERIGPLEFQGDPIGYLRTKQADLETAAQAFLQKGQRLEAEAAANAARSMALAQKNYNQLLPVARKARSQFDAQFKREQVAGIDTDYERWYVPQRHELDLFASPDRPIILGENRAGGGTTFRKAKVYEDYASAIEDGFVPKSTDIADLLENRVYQGEAMIQRRELFNKLKLFKDPVDGKPMVTKVPRRVITRENGEIDVQESVPRGYQKFQVMPGVNVAVHDGYARLLRALTATSQISESAVVGTLQDIAAIEKHIGLALDTFHASRTLQAELALTGKLSIGEHQKRGLALVEYKPSDLDLAAQKGLITQEMADWVRRPTEMEVGGKKVKLSPHALIVLGAKNGLNMARIADVMYRDWLREVPITGDVNKWVFDKMTRSAISQSFLVEFERAAKANPHLKAEPVARMVARDINTFFGNLQAESIFKNPSLNAINQILFLAPRWVEALATREARFVKQAGQAGKDIIFGRKLGLPEIQKTETGTTTLQRYTHVPYVGTIGKGVGTGLAAYLIGTQLLNLFTRHQLTFQNKEEGHRLDAWIPPLPGTAGPGFFISPLSVFGEITHDILRLAETKPDLASAISQIGQNKLGNLGRFFEVVASGRDPLTNEKIIGTGRRAISAAAQIIPIPIAMSQVARAGIAKGAPELFTPPPPGSVQRQLTASMGFKTEPVPSAQQQVYRMADAWKRSSRDPRLQREVERRLKEDFGPSDYRQLRGALIGGNLEDAAQAYDALIRDGKSSKQIRETMGHPHPFTGSARHERDFKHVLTPEQRKTYEAAIKERQDLFRRFEQMLREKHQRKE